ncbi:MAG: hypothetical protein CTY25_03685 [Methylobacterium sp.]|nr:MAG: hypothetical protein CTY25_03685 [Methylobacterium sp.]
MPNSYDPTRDPYAAVSRSPSEPGAVAQALTPNDGADLPLYCKAFRVYVPLSLQGASVRVTPVLANDDLATVTLSFPQGISYEPLSIRRIWATGTSTGIEIHGYAI